MENNEQIERIEAFLNEVIINEIGKLQGIGLSYMQFVIMGQAIEVLGSFLDNKPMKAKGQSAKRFSYSVNRLFGGRYRLLNDKEYLYDKLRNQMTHTFLPSGDLLLLSQKENTAGYQHLEMKDKKLIMISEVFYSDIRQACERLVCQLKEGRMLPKNIAFGYDE